MSRRPPAPRPPRNARILDRHAGYCHVAVYSPSGEVPLWDYRSQVPPRAPDLLEITHASQQHDFDPKIVLLLLREREQR